MTKISTLQEYFEFIESYSLALIHFWADWNGQDFTMRNRLEEIESSYKEFVRFGTVAVDVEDMFQTFRELNIVNIPTLAYYKNGKCIEIVIGVNQKIEERLNLLIG